MATQYPEGKPAVSPRLSAPKLPTINITTTPTGAMNRAGQGVASPHLDHNRLEYFDPKTRPRALIWDHEAIMATPFSMMHGFAVNSFVGAALTAGRRSENPLAEGDRDHIRKLANRAYHRIREDPDAIDWRLDLFVGALLANRAADDSQRGAHMGGGEAFGKRLRPQHRTAHQVRACVATGLRVSSARHGDPAVEDPCSRGDGGDRAAAQHLERRPES